MHHTAGTALHPFEALTPDLVLDALDSVGLRGDGRLMALSSYENRVYQVQLEDGAPVVAKFYRPGRWSDAQIQEEHDFAAELAAAEIPAVGPLMLNGPGSTEGPPRGESRTPLGGSDPRSGGAWGPGFTAGPPQGGTAPSGGSDPRSGGAWGPGSTEGPPRGESRTPSGGSDPRSGGAWGPGSTAGPPQGGTAPSGGSDPRSGGAWGPGFTAGPPQGETAPSGSSDPRSGGAWGPGSTEGPLRGESRTPLGGSDPRSGGAWGPQSLHHFGGFAFSVSPRRGGRPPELDDGEVLEWIGRFLARIHTVGAKRPFVHRPALDVQSFAIEPMQWLLANEMVPLDVQTLWSERCQQAIELIATRSDMAGATGQNKANSSGIRQLRLHGDCHPGNILWTPTDVAASAGPGPHFVDLDDARTGPAVQDLWMLLSGDRQQQARQLGMLVDGYEQFREFDRAELALIEPLRTLRLIYYSAWLARRWSDPIFPANFPWFGSSDYWKGQIQVLEDQIEAMGEDPLIV